jgi:hypothetical protein
MTVANGAQDFLVQPGQCYKLSNIIIGTRHCFWSVYILENLAVNDE